MTKIATHKNKQQGHAHSPSHDASRFVDAVFGNAVSDGRLIAVWTKADKKTQCFDGSEALVQYGLAAASSSDVYIGMGVFSVPPAKRGTAQDVTGITVLWADFDVAGAGHQTQKRYPPTEEAVLGILAEVGLASSILVRTGGGLHAYWLLDRPWLFNTDADRKEAAAFIKRWGSHLHAVAKAKGFELDNVADLARVLRLPGTLNHKSAEPRPVSVFELNADRRYSRAQIELVMQGARPGQVTKDATPLTRKPISAARLDRLFAARLSSPAESREKLKALWVFGKWQECGYPSQSEADLALCNQIVKLTKGHADRTDRLFRLSPLYRPKWDECHFASGETYGHRTIAVALERYQRAKRTYSDHPLSLPVASCAPGKYPLTDLGNAERFIEQHGNELLCRDGRWIAFGGQCWGWDNQAIGERAKDTVRSINAEAQGASEDDLRIATLKHAKGSESGTRISAMLRVAKSQMHSTAAWDQDRRLLNVQSGTLDLRTGLLRKHCRNDFVTRVAPVRYDANAACPRWEKFLLEIMGGDTDMVAFLQRSVGYTLTGETNEHCIFILHGTGRNGKSTFLEVLRLLLGDSGHVGYSHKLDASALQRSRSDTHRYDFAALSAVRFAYCSEQVSERSLDAERLKELSGGESISARQPYERVFNFRPAFKIWIGTNDCPNFRHDDPAVWDRLKLIPFRQRFYDTAEEAIASGASPSCVKNKHLLTLLQRELPGILAWAVRGCITWQQDGLGVPPAVQRATAEYQRRTDLIGQFLEQRCIFSPELCTPSGVMWNNFLAYAHERGGTARRDQFTERLVSQVGGAPTPKRVHGNVERCWLGVGLRPE